MRLLLVLVLVGVAVYFLTNRAPAPLERRSAEQDSTHATAGQPEPPVRRSARVGDRDWNLTPNNIRDELARTGRVVREKARQAGERIDDARVIATIKGKYALDSDLSVGDIKVECNDGRVVLTGTIGSAELIGRAVELALHTDGVGHVESRLQDASEAPSR